MVKKSTRHCFSSYFYKKRKIPQNARSRAMTPNVQTPASAASLRSAQICPSSPLMMARIKPIPRIRKLTCILITRYILGKYSRGFEIKILNAEDKINLKTNYMIISLPELAKSYSSKRLIIDINPQNAKEYKILLEDINS